MLVLKSVAPVQVTSNMLSAPAETVDSTFTEEVEPEEDDSNWENWEIKEREKIERAAW